MPIQIRAFAALLITAGWCHAGTLVLKLAWIEQFKDRATIDASFTVDHAHPRPNPPANDGDIHVAGRAPTEIGLPMVAEVMNAKNDQPGVQKIHAVEGKNSPIAVTGAWRLWFEHPPSSGAQTQFNTVPVPANTNPDHCFEIHPLTNVAGNDLTGSFHTIVGFTPKDADAAFGSYEKLTVTVRANTTAVTLDSPKSGFNYVLFVMRPLGAPTKLKDGGLAFLCDVAADVGEDAIARNVRMIFVPGTPPFKAVENGFSEDLKVLGIPRVNLHDVSAFIKANTSAVKAAAGVKRKLPYEMIVVALEPQS